MEKKIRFINVFQSRVIIIFLLIIVNKGEHVKLSRSNATIISLCETINIYFYVIFFYYLRWWEREIIKIIIKINIKANAKIRANAKAIIKAKAKINAEIKIIKAEI